MKKFLIAILAILLCFGTAFCFIACKDDNTESSTELSIDYPLSSLSDQKAFDTTQVILDNPTEFEGKSIRIKGTFYKGSLNGDGKTHYFVVLSDPASCCAATKTAFAWDGELPSLNSAITVTGTFVAKKSNGNTYPEIQATKVKF